MKFVQIIEYKTTRLDEVQKLNDEFLAKTEGKRPEGHAYSCKDRDNADTYIEIIEFPSYEEAMRNNELPETQEFAEKMMALCDGPATFRNLDVMEEME